MRSNEITSFLIEVVAVGLQNELRHISVAWGKAGCTAAVWFAQTGKTCGLQWEEIGEVRIFKVFGELFHAG